MSNWYNYEYSDKIICPYCAEEYEPTYEDTYIGGELVDCYTECEQEFVCDKCHKRFNLTGEMTWTYYTSTIEEEEEK